MRLRNVDPALLAIVGEGFLSRLSFGLISFALPLYAYRLGLSLTAIGLLLSLNLVVAIALKPVMGAAADRFGRKVSFATAIALRSAVSLLLVFATLPWHLFATRSIHGISIAIRDPAANTLLAEHGGKKAVASAFAWYQTAKSLAGILGKSLAGILLAVSASSFSLVFAVAFVLSLLPLLLVVRYVREPSAELQTVEEPVREAVPERAPAPKPSLLPFAGLGFLISGTAYMLSNLFPILAVEYAGLSEAQAGLVYSLTAVVVLAGPVFGWLSDNVSRKLVLSLRSAANVLSSVVYLVAPNFAGMAIGRAVDDLGKAAFRPAWGALMAHVSGFDRKRRARTMGYLSSGEDAGEVAGPIVAGLIWSAWGVPALLAVRIGVAIVTELYTIALAGSLGRLEGQTVDRTSHAVEHRYLGGRARLSTRWRRRPGEAP
jgi:MFS family permease